jgi:hypothetical protein
MHWRISVINDPSGGAARAAWWLAKPRRSDIFCREGSSLQQAINHFHQLPGGFQLVGAGDLGDCVSDFDWIKVCRPHKWPPQKDGRHATYCHQRLILRLVGGGRYLCQQPPVLIPNRRQRDQALVDVPPSIGQVIFGTLGVGWVMTAVSAAIRRPDAQGGGVWEPGARQWLIERWRIGPVIRELKRTVDPLFRRVAFTWTDENL